MHYNVQRKITHSLLVFTSFSFTELVGPSFSIAKFPWRVTLLWPLILGSTLIALTQEIEFAWNGFIVRFWCQCQCQCEECQCWCQREGKILGNWCTGMRRKRAWAELAAGLRVRFTNQPVPSSSTTATELKSNPRVIEYDQQMRIGQLWYHARCKMPQATLTHSSACLL